VDDLFTLFTTGLDAAGVDYMITGSVASMVYGEPRPAHDVDLVVALPDEGIDALVAAFPDSEFYCPPAEVIRVEARRADRGHFVIIHHDSGFRADVYIVGRDPFHGWAMARRRQVALGETTLHIAPAEYVIARKLEYYRSGGGPQHLEDIRGILRSSPDAIDAAELGRMIAERGLMPQWAEIDS